MITQEVTMGLATEHALVPARRSRRRRGWPFVALALVVAVVLPASARSDADALPPGVAAQFATAGFPAHVTAAFGSVWASAHRATVLYRINPRRNRVARRIIVPFNSCLPIGKGAEQIWVSACSMTTRTAEVSPRRNAVTAVRDGKPYVAAGSSVWTIRRGEVVRLGPSGTVTGRVSVPSAYIVGFGLGSAWVTDAEGLVTRIDAESMSVVAAIPLPGYGVDGSQPGGGYRYGGQLAFEAGAVWVTGPNGLYRIDPATNRAARYDIGIRDLSQWGDLCVVAARGSLFVRTKDTEVVRVDPATGGVVDRYPAGGGGGCIAVGFGSLWVANFATHSVWRIPL